MEIGRTNRDIIIGVLKYYLGRITEEEIPFVTAVNHMGEITTIIDELENPENS